MNIPGPRGSTQQNMRNVKVLCSLCGSRSPILLPKIPKEAVKTAYAMAISGHNSLERDELRLLFYRPKRKNTAAR